MSAVSFARGSVLDQTTSNRNASRYFAVSRACSRPSSVSSPRDSASYCPCRRKRSVRVATGRLYCREKENREQEQGGIKREQRTEDREQRIGMGMGARRTGLS